jgi:hypothetical protein
VDQSGRAVAAQRGCESSNLALTEAKELGCLYFVEGTVQEPTNDCCLTVDGAVTGEISSNKVVNSWMCITVGWNGGPIRNAE